MNSISLKTIPLSVFKIARYFDLVELKPAAEGLPVQIRQIIKSHTKTKLQQQLVLNHICSSTAEDMYLVAHVL